MNYLLLSIHNTVGYITLVGAAAVIFTVIFLFQTAGKEDTDNTASKKVYKFRRKYFWSLFAIVLVSFLTSLTFLPFKNKGGEVDKTFSVLAFQWGWQIAEGDTILNFKREDLKRFRGKISIDVKTNDNVEFIVTSRDVNHGLGIYNDQGTMVAQVQAMPGVNNNLYYKFEESGVYKIICMEYCGISHHRMVATITVSEKGGEIIPEPETIVEEEVVLEDESINDSLEVFAEDLGDDLETDIEK